MKEKISSTWNAFMNIVAWAVLIFFITITTPIVLPIAVYRAIKEIMEEKRNETYSM